MAFMGYKLAIVSICGALVRHSRALTVMYGHIVILSPVVVFDLAKAFEKKQMIGENARHRLNHFMVIS